MKSFKLMVAYPQPKDASAFERIYQQEHVPMAIAISTGRPKWSPRRSRNRARRASVLPLRGGSFFIH